VQSAQRLTCDLWRGSHARSNGLGHDDGLTADFFHHGIRARGGGRPGFHRAAGPGWPAPAAGCEAAPGRICWHDPLDQCRRAGLAFIGFEGTGILVCSVIGFPSRHHAAQLRFRLGEPCRITNSPAQPGRRGVETASGVCAVAARLARVGHGFALIAPSTGRPMVAFSSLAGGCEGRAELAHRERPLAAASRPGRRSSTPSSSSGRFGRRACAGSSGGSMTWNLIDVERSVSDLAAQAQLLAVLQQLVILPVLQHVVIAVDPLPASAASFRDWSICCA
jgi:hypothetical protein